MILKALKKGNLRMRLQFTPTTVATYSLLGLAAVISFALPDQLSPSGAAALPAPAAADTLRLTGIVWDFKDGHPDFPATDGRGHHAGNVDFGLNASGRPVFNGAGFRVGSQWYDNKSNPIPWFLAMNPGALRVTDAPTIDKDAFFDTWDSTKGPYGGANRGAAPSIATGARMPSISVPNVGPSTGVAFYQLVAAINSNLHCSSFSTRRDTLLTILGNITIVCDGNFETGQRTQILMGPNSSLRLYVGGQLRINQTSQVNMNTFDPNRCQIFCTSSSTVEINQSNQVCARITAPKAVLHLAQNDHFYGTFTGKTIDLDQATGFHHDGAPMTDLCSNAVNDIDGSSSGAATGGITSAASFGEWYTDTMGTNLSGRHTIELTRNASGVFEYLDNSFYPVDGQLFGNEGQSHNNLFTYAIRTTFEYDSCAGQFFEFQGTDDAWLFINGQLAMDLGGVVAGTQQYVEIDRLGLSDGQSYTFEFFYAQRQVGQAVFRIRTNLPLVGDTEVAAVSAGFD